MVLNNSEIERAETVRMMKLESELLLSKEQVVRESRREKSSHQEFSMISETSMLLYFCTCAEKEDRGEVSNFARVCALGSTVGPGSES